jgi:hypothetical protein
VKEGLAKLNKDRYRKIYIVPPYAHLPTVLITDSEKHITSGVCRLIWTAVNNFFDMPVRTHVGRGYFPVSY